MTIIKLSEDSYSINLTYDELNVIYHCVGNHCELLNGLLACNMGLRLTGAESCIYDKAENISKNMRTSEPLLYHDLRFEGNKYE